MADRAAWTDARLDDLVDRIDKRLDSLDTSVRELRAEMRDLRLEIREVRTELRGGIDGLGTELRAEVSAVRRDGVIATTALLAAIIGTGVLT